jgi:hypothetical protein
VTRTLLVSTSHSLLRVDAESGAYEPLHRGRGLYFGIASDGTRYFVAARGRMVSSADSAEDERGCILVFDRALRPLGELAAPFPMRDLHEILWQDGKLWVTCSYDNMIAVLDESSNRWESWYPFGPASQPPFDVNHLNSLAFDAGDLCVVAHNCGSIPRAGSCARERPSESNRTTSAERAKARSSRAAPATARWSRWTDGASKSVGSRAASPSSKTRPTSASRRSPSARIAT